MSTQKLFSYIDSHVDGYVEDLRKICKQPSISAQNKGIHECVHLLTEMMTEAGIDVKVIPVRDGNPVVFGELKLQGAKQTLGFYNHYDVQPPEPLEWILLPSKPKSWTEKSLLEVSKTTREAS